MTANSTNSDSTGQEAASTKKMAFYAFGWVITAHLIVAFDSYIFYYYEVEVGLPVLLVSIAVVIFTLWTIIISPILGYLTDRPFKWSKKYGFRAPWIVVSAIPALLLYILVYIPPNIDVKSNPWPIFWYFVIISCIFEALFAVYRQHYSAIYPMLFRQDIDRKKSAVMTFLISNPIILLLSLFPIYIIVYGDRSTFIFTSLITAGIMAVCLALTIPGITESDEIKQRFLQGYRVNEEKIPFLKICGICIRNKNFMVSLISFALCYIALMLYVASYIYFFKDVLELPLTYALLPVLGSFIAMAISMPLWNRLSRKHDHSRIYMIGIILSAILHLPFLWITTIEEYTILSILRGVATSCFFFMLQPISADVYDEITLKCERHLEATLHGLRNIIFRSSAIFIAIILGGVHIATMYNPNPDAKQPPMAVWGIRVHTGLIPAIFFIAAFVMMLFYDLKGEKSLVTKKMLHEKGL